MYLVFLLSGIVFIPQANSLKCNHYHVSLAGSSEGQERQCSGEFTRCGTVREETHERNNGSVFLLRGSCVKADDCKDGSLNIGFATYYYTSTCCDTDMCNNLHPVEPNTKTNPNGRKCHRCDGKSDCTGTLNCDGEETFCASATSGDITIKGCATRSRCGNPSILPTDVKGVQCCEGDYCNDGSSTRACLLLLTVMLILLFFFPN